MHTIHALLPSLFGRTPPPREKPQGQPVPAWSDEEAQAWDAAHEQNPDLFYSTSQVPMETKERIFLYLTESGWEFRNGFAFKSPLHRLAFERFQGAPFAGGKRNLEVVMSEWHPSDHEIVINNGLGRLERQPTPRLVFSTLQDMYLFQAYLGSRSRQEALKKELLIPVDAPPGMPLPRGRWLFGTGFTRGEVEILGGWMTNVGPHVVFRPIGGLYIETCHYHVWPSRAIPLEPWGMDAPHCAE